MKAKLLAHAHAEQEVLYRRLEASQREASRNFALEGTNEHQILEKQLQKLSAEGDKTSEQWAAELKVLRELVEHHEFHLQNSVELLNDGIDVKLESPCHRNSPSPWRDSSHWTTIESVPSLGG